jgi:hypothetical protein
MTQLQIIDGFQHEVEHNWGMGVSEIVISCGICNHFMHGISFLALPLHTPFSLERENLNEILRKRFDLVQRQLKPSQYLVVRAVSATSL